MPTAAASFLKSAPVLIGAGVGATIGAASGFAPKADDEFTDPYRRAGTRALGLGLAGAAGGLLLGGNYARIPGAAAWGFKKAAGVVESASASVSARAAAFEAAGSTKVGATASAFARSPFFMTAAGAGVGAIIGAHYDRPGAGAAIGAGVGLGTVAALKSTRVLKTPAGRIGTILTLSAALLYGGEAMKASSAETVTFGRPDGMGGYTYSSTPEGNVRQRINAMNASGDVVLGLHNLRHGR